MDKDIEELKEKLKDYYGTAMTNGFPMAVFELSEVDELSDDEIMEKAESLGLWSNPVNV